MSSCTVGNEFLCNHSLFGGLTHEELELLRPRLKESRYTAGAYLLEQGEPNSSVFFIIEGSVAIIKHALDAADADREIAVLSTGDSFGEMELIDIQPCAASVKALTDTTVATFTNRDLYELSHSHLKTYTMIIMNLAREISRRLRVTDEKLAAELYRKPVKH